MSVNLETVGGNGTFDQVIAGSSPQIQALAIKCRALIADVLPGATEVPWAKQRTVGYGVGPKKMSEHFCYIAPQKTHVNIGFFYGALLDDKECLLEGSGKMLRHIKIRSSENLGNPAVRALIKQASGVLPNLDA
jgi:hypothetical protein